MARLSSDPSQAMLIARLAAGLRATADTGHIRAPNLKLEDSEDDGPGLGLRVTVLSSSEGGRRPAACLAYPWAFLIFNKRTSRECRFVAAPIMPVVQSYDAMGIKNKIAAPSPCRCHRANRAP